MKLWDLSEGWMVEFQGVILDRRQLRAKAQRKWGSVLYIAAYAPAQCIPMQDFCDIFQSTVQCIVWCVDPIVQRDTVKKIFSFLKTFQIFGKYLDFWKIFRFLIKKSDFQKIQIFGRFSDFWKIFQIFGRQQHQQRQP